MSRALISPETMIFEVFAYCSSDRRLLRLPALSIWSVRTVSFWANRTPIEKNRVVKKRIILVITQIGLERYFCYLVVEGDEINTLR